MPSARTGFRLALVLTLVVSTQSLLIVQGAFHLRRDFIAQRLCVNPETDCDGSCYLKERMLHHGHQHDDRVAPPAHEHDGPTKVALLEIALAVQALLPPQPPLGGTGSDQEYVIRPDQVPRAIFAVEVFHPPRIG
ncbi:MAG: hypothetical protein HKN04_13950 [Rhodothermaceae bacterium]|nr:hypothetical protein [Rhodothermaceae bacterium]